MQAYELLDRLYVPLDRSFIRRARNIRLIPQARNRRGGKHSYAEWGHVIGIFQTLIYLHRPRKCDIRVLDVGCGTGLMGIASEPFLGEHGHYTGIDVGREDIDFCRRHYPKERYSFVHLDVKNARYAPRQGDRAPWPLASSSFDLAAGLSVWTHLNEEDAIFYVQELDRVLRPGGTAILSLFLLDEEYRDGLSRRSDRAGRYHMTAQDRWVFDVPAYGSNAWFCPKWATVPEDAIAVTRDGFERLLSGTCLRQEAYYPGNWKEIPGAFFQDVLVLAK